RGSRRRQVPLPAGPQRGRRRGGSVLIPLEQIRSAQERLAGKVVRTPLLRLATDSPATIYLKPENLQPIGSFKLRGALNAISQLPATELEAGVVTASA